MKNYYPQDSLFDNLKLHPFFIILMGLSINIVFFSVIDGFFSKISHFVIGINYEDFSKALQEKNIPDSYLNFYLLRLTVLQIIGFGFTGWLFAHHAGHWKNELFLHLPFSLNKILWAGIIMLVAIPFFQFFIITDINPEDYPELKAIEEQTQNILNQIMKSNLFLNILLFGLVPAICEEIFFRGFLFQNFNRFLFTFWAVFFSSFIFSIYHVQIYGLFARAVMGGMLAFFFYASKSLYTAIFAHFINNSLVTFLTWLALNNYLSKDIIQPTYKFDTMWVILSFVLTLILSLMYYAKNYENEKVRLDESC